MTRPERLMASGLVKVWLTHRTLEWPAGCRRHFTIAGARGVIPPLQGVGSSRDGSDHAPLMWQATFKGATHCEAGCALGELPPGTGSPLPPPSPYSAQRWAAASPCRSYWLTRSAWCCSTSRLCPSGTSASAKGGLAAIKIDTLSLLACEVGMFVVMASWDWLYPDLKTDELDVLAVNAGGGDRRLSHDLPGELVADPPRH